MHPDNRSLSKLSFVEIFISSDDSLIQMGIRIFNYWNSDFFKPIGVARVNVC